MSKRIWFITGTSSGIGRELTERILSEGDVVIATLRKPSAIADLVATYSPDVLLPIELDVTNKAQVSNAFERAKDAFGRIDVVVNNAGIGLMAEFEGTPEEDARKVFDVNYWGTANVTREALRFLREVNPPGMGGSILQVSSVTGVVGVPVVAHYSASKHALEGLTEAISKELDPAWNIQLCLIEPSGFATVGVSTLPTFPVHPAYEANKSLAAHQVRFSTSAGVEGDAAKLAKVVYDVVSSGNIPARLPIGLDSVGAMRTKAEQLLETVQSTGKWSADVKREDLGSHGD